MYADYVKLFILHTDGRYDGLGAVLCQEQGGLEMVIAYARLLDVEEWVRKCVRCKVSKGVTAKAPLVNIVVTQPLELVCLDYLTLEMSQGAYEYVLVVTDPFHKICSSNTHTQSNSEDNYRDVYQLFCYSLRIAKQDPHRPRQEF